MARRLRKDERVLDFLIFGSAVRGKERPGDVDFVVLFKSSVDASLLQEVEKELKVAGINADVKGKTWQELFELGFLARENILAEAYSLTSGASLHEMFGYGSFAMFRYSLDNKSPSERTRFSYALLGRKTRNTRETGILGELGGRKLSGSAVIIPIPNEEKFKEFLGNWGAEFKLVHVLVPERAVEHNEF